LHYKEFFGGRVTEKGEIQQDEGLVKCFDYLTASYDKTNCNYKRTLFLFMGPNEIANAKADDSAQLKSNSDAKLRNAILLARFDSNGFAFFVGPCINFPRAILISITNPILNYAPEYDYSISTVCLLT